VAAAAATRGGSIADRPESAVLTLDYEPASVATAAAGAATATSVATAAAATKGGSIADRPESVLSESGTYFDASDEPEYFDANSGDESTEATEASSLDLLALEADQHTPKTTTTKKKLPKIIIPIVALALALSSWKSSGKADLWQVRKLQDLGLSREDAQEEFRTIHNGLCKSGDKIGDKNLLLEGICGADIPSGEEGSYVEQFYKRMADNFISSMHRRDAISQNFKS
jgi:hypothetical protein